MGGARGKTSSGALIRRKKDYHAVGRARSKNKEKRDTEYKIKNIFSREGAKTQRKKLPWGEGIKIIAFSKAYNSEILTSIKNKIPVYIERAFRLFQLRQSQQLNHHRLLDHLVARIRPSLLQYELVRR